MERIIVEAVVHREEEVAAYVPEVTIPTVLILDRQEYFADANSEFVADSENNLIVVNAY